MPDRKRRNENYHNHQLARQQSSEAGAGSAPEWSRWGATSSRRPRSLPASASPATCRDWNHAIDSAANVIMQPAAAKETSNTTAIHQLIAAQRLDIERPSGREATRRDSQPEDDTASRSRAKPTQLTLEAGTKWAPFASAKRAPSLIAPVTLVGLYCLLTACALVVRCAPTGSQRVKSGAKGGAAGEQHVVESRRTTPAAQTTANDDLLGVIDVVEPVGLLLTSFQNQRHAKPAGGEQYNGQRRQPALEEANISRESPSETALLLARNKQPGRHMEAAQDGASDGGHDEDERQILLVLASDTAPSPSSLRRLSKRSGISDQRLAEIQMIRALKKQLERAATKIAADSTGDGEGDNGGSQTATTGGEMTSA